MVEIVYALRRFSIVALLLVTFTVLGQRESSLTIEDT